jgi:magnesium transporter
LATQLSLEEIMVLTIKYLKEQRKAELQAVLDELQPYDMAVLYADFPEKHRSRFITYLTSAQIADLLEELAPEVQTDLLYRLGVTRSAEIMGMMENDDLADLLGRLSVETIEQYLQSMKKEDSAQVQRLLQYPSETAGGIMTNRYVWIPQHYSVREAVDKLKLYASVAESIHYLYVLDQEHKLVGVVSYRDLLLAGLEDTVSGIMYHRVISIPAHMDQEEVAGIIERYDFIAVPVVDESGRLIGIVTVDDVLDVVIREANEDIAKLSASGRDIDFRTKAFTAAWRRLPWLVLLLGLGLVSGSIISFFESTLQKAVALTFFMPMIAGMTGNTGTQSLAIIVRGLASNRIDKPTVYRLIAREASVGLIIGIVCGTAVAIAGALWQGNPALGLIVGASLFLTLVIGTLAGTVIPLLLFRFRIDPAIASGPLITTLNDIFSLLVYFGIATLFLSRLAV